MDGYLSWRLSGNRSQGLFNTITANDINIRNTNKVTGFNKLFGTDVRLIHGDMNMIVGKFDICSIMGSSYFLDKPLEALSLILKNNVKKTGVVYIDFRCLPEKSYRPRHPSFSPQDFTAYSEGDNMPIGIKFRNVQTASGIGFINHPEKYTDSIFYRFADIVKYIESLRNVKKVRLLLKEDEETTIRSSSWIILAIHT